METELVDRRTFASHLAAAVAGVPRAFVRCTADRAIPIAAQDNWIAQADALTPANRFVQRSLPTSQSPFFSAPADLVAALVSLV